MLELSEIFSSLQGEGPYMGRPATFIRLSGCIKPYCPWCDTGYARENGHAASIDEILAKVAQLKNRLAVITGGEPFRQWDTGLAALERRLTAGGYRIQYETSGKAGIPESIQGRVVCSPKFLGGRWRFDPADLPRVDEYKFVVAGDFREVTDFIRAHHIPAETVWIMPRGATRARQLARMADTWRFCVQHGYNFAPRLHTLAFDNKKGV